MLSGPQSSLAVSPVITRLQPLPPPAAGTLGSLLLEASRALLSDLGFLFAAFANVPLPIEACSDHPTSVMTFTYQVLPTLVCLFSCNIFIEHSYPLYVLDVNIYFPDCRMCSVIIHHLCS